MKYIILSLLFIIPFVSSADTLTPDQRSAIIAEIQVLEAELQSILDTLTPVVVTPPDTSTTTPVTATSTDATSTPLFGNVITSQNGDCAWSIDVQTRIRSYACGD